MRKSNKVIVSCAVTGSIHVPTMTPYLPVTADQIAENAIGAAEAGAAILHLHARNEETGQPSQAPEDYARFLPRIKQSCNAVVNITTGGGLGMTLDQRLAAAKWAKPEVASMNMGSLNFGIFGAAEKIKEFKYDWERPYLEMTKDFILSNTFTQIERGLKELGEYGTKFEFECYDIGHLYTCAHFVERGLIKPPFFIQSVFGLLGGIGAHPEDVMHMKRTADRLFGKDYRWSVLGAGRNQMPIAMQSVMMGGNLRVGLEDSLWAGKGKLAESNAEQVRIARELVERLGMEIATPDEAREILGLKGGDKVEF